MAKSLATLENLSRDVALAQHKLGSLGIITDALDALEQRVNRVQKQQTEAFLRRRTELMLIQDQRLEDLRRKLEEKASRFVNLTSETLRGQLNLHHSDRVLQGLLFRADKSLHYDRWAFLKLSIEAVYWSWGLMCLYVCLFVAWLFPSCAERLGLLPATALHDLPLPPLREKPNPIFSNSVSMVN